MISDLQGQGAVEAQADFIVIGAGTVGLPTCVRLAQKTGKHVVCLESGGYRQAEETHPLNEVVHVASRYDGAMHGRFRCLGGTSTRWGGALIPFQSADVEEDGWPIPMADLEPYVTDVEELFGLEPGPYSDPFFPFDIGETHVNRLAKWPPFKRRNVVDLVGKECRTLANLNVWLNATVVAIQAGTDGTGVEVQAQSPSGDTIRLAAARLIVAAGAIETTRLALLIDQQSGGAVRALSPSLGRYFADHISVGIADIEPRKPKALNKIIGFRFSGGGCMRNLRFEFASDAAARKSLPPCFADVRFELQQPGGFEALREVLRGAQKQQLPSAAVCRSLVRHLPWLLRAAWWRFVHKRLLFPAHARLTVHTVIAQTSNADNTIRLSETRRDPFGVPLAEIRWRVSDKDIDNVEGAADLMEKMWRGSDFAAHGVWQRIASETVATRAREAGAFLHPTGSTRIGRDADEGVVDRDLHVFAMPQIQLLSTSVLPTPGGANPTMMLMMLALRCIDQHARACIE